MVGVWSGRFADTCPWSGQPCLPGTDWQVQASPRHIPGQKAPLAPRSGRADPAGGGSSPKFTGELHHPAWSCSMAGSVSPSATSVWSVWEKEKELGFVQP